jgi:DNA (cytosine-5)-methyltransferase 1
MIKVGSDFSGVGAFNQSLMRLGIEFKEIFACDMDKYARQTFIHNYGEPEYYPTNVYDRKIPSESLDIYMTSPPCQAFSLAGKRLGKDDKRGILFFNSHEFIQVNKPRYFIFENVKGLLSDDGGKTFQEWVNMLGGKSVNGVPVLFPYDESVPYHLYWKVLNAKHHGVPQNRERVFLIGIRDDVDNDFQFPKEEYLSKRLKDVLEDGVVDKYFLSEKMINYFDSRSSNFNNGNINFKDEESVASTITSSSKSLDISDNIIRLTNVNPSGNGMNGNVYGNEGISPTLSTNKGEGIKIGAFRGRNPDKPSDRTTGVQTEQKLEININGTSNTLTSVQKDNVVIENCKIRRLTPRECFRLMDFPDCFTWPVSDSQAYKQAGNSIVVNVLYKIIKNLSI